MQNILLITPNIPEAEILSKTKINSTKDMVKAGKILIGLGAKNVLIKGGHLKSKQMNDILMNKKLLRFLEVKSIIQKIHMVLDAHYLLQLQHIYHVEKI